MQIRSVEASKGLTWFEEGWRLFVLKPWMWIVLAFTWMIISVVLLVFPVIGRLVDALIFPTLYSGFLYGAREVDSGRDLKIVYLFQALVDPATRVPVFVLGILPLGFLIVVNFVALAFGFSVLAFAVLAPLSILMSLALVYACPLVIFHGVEPVAAIKSSFNACLKNIIPVLIFGIVNFVLSLVAGITFGLGFLVLLPVTSCALYRSFQSVYRDV